MQGRSPTETLKKLLEDVQEKRMSVNDQCEDPLQGGMLTNLAIFASKYGDEVILQKLVDEGLRLGSQGPIFKYPDGTIRISKAIGAAAYAGNLKTLKYLVGKVPD